MVDLKNKGVEKGLIEQHVDNQDRIINLVFESGLSTAHSVTDISGRGVGMVAIRTYIENVGGSIHIKAKSQSNNDQEIPVEFELLLPPSLYQSAVAS